MYDPEVMSGNETSKEYARWSCSTLQQLCNATCPGKWLGRGGILYILLGRQVWFYSCGD